MRKVLSLFCGFAVLGIYFLALHREKVSTEREFFEYILIREQGAYTLLGSKPMTEMVLDYPLADDQSISEASQGEPVAVQGKKAYEKALSQLYSNCGCKYQSQSPGFALGVYRVDPENSSLILTNKESLRTVLNENYELVCSIVGEVYEIGSILDDLVSFRLPFWKKAFDSHVLNGLLFGYGLLNVNAYQEEDSFGQTFPISKATCSINEIVTAHVKLPIKVEDLILPMFGSYSDPDPQVLQYEKEREEIIEMYRGKDLRRVFIDVFEGGEPINPV